MPRCSTLHHHSPELQETSSQRKKIVPGKADPASSEHKDQCRRCWRTARRPFRCSPTGAIFHRPSREGRGWGGAGRERALRAPLKPFGCLFCCLGQLALHVLKKSFPGRSIDVRQTIMLLDLCVSSSRRGHGTILCIVPNVTDDLQRESRRKGNRKASLCQKRKQMSLPPKGGLQGE